MQQHGRDTQRSLQVRRRGGDDQEGWTGHLGLPQPVPQEGRPHAVTVMRLAAGIRSMEENARSRQKKSKRAPVLAEAQVQSARCLFLSAGSASRRVSSGSSLSHPGRGVTPTCSTQRRQWCTRCHFALVDSCEGRGTGMSSRTQQRVPLRR